ncbi:MAG: hypothetical protein ABJA67_04650 [Chthonomonadales bacterium]
MKQPPLPANVAKVWYSVWLVVGLGFWLYGVLLITQPGSTDKMVGAICVLIGAFRSISSIYFLWRLFGKKRK